VSYWRNTHIRIRIHSVRIIDIANDFPNCDALGVDLVPMKKELVFFFPLKMVFLMFVF